mmetsp:Transcript_10782/g.13023  ORF Transcript_10782/g.13023 Transcript_10782/m.13023 type:complete len:226 (-) Transcript_10782:199-876(-)
MGDNFHRVRENSVFKRGAVAASISLVGCLVSLLTPWVTFRYAMPTFFPGSVGVKGPLVEVGLLKCFSDVCVLYEKASGSKIPLKLQKESSQTSVLYTVTVIAAVGTFVCLILSCVNVIDNLYPSLVLNKFGRNNAIRLQLVASSCFLGAASVYMIVTLYTLEDAQFQIGVVSALLTSSLSISICYVEEVMEERLQMNMMSQESSNLIDKSQNHFNQTNYGLVQTP